jgi:PQQ enzyme repeat
VQRRYSIALCSLALSLICSGCGSGGLTPPVITTQPADQNSTLGQAATFSVVAASSGPRAYQWQRGGTPIDGATLPFYTTPPLAMGDNGTEYNVVVSNSAGTATSTTAKLTVIAVTDVVTFHNDTARTGQNTTETLLTPVNVNSTQFGRLGVYSTDGLVDVQPLYVGSVAVPHSGKHNLLIVATEHGSVYAFDADTGATIWRSSTLGPGETPSDDLQCGAVTPEIGVTATPVIDRWRGANGAVYLVAMTEDLAGNYHQRVHALDLAQGTELFGGPNEIRATYPGTGDNSDGTNVIFDPAQYFERAGLLLLNDVIYMSWASHCDVRPYTGWIMGYSASTLAQVSVLNITPNAGQGAIWMSAGGLAADNVGNVFFAQGNGYFDPTLNAAGFPNDGDYGNAFMKLSTIGGLSVADYFEMDAEKAENAADIDLGAGGVLLLPDLKNGSGQTLHLATSAGKDGNLYVLNRDALGKTSPDDQNLYQKLGGVLPGGIWSTPAYFNNTIYYGPVFSPIRALSIGDAKLSPNPVAQTPNAFGYPGATPSISANGTSNGIVWAVETVSITSAAVLHAYDAASLNELYNSNQASGGRDLFGNGNKFVTPTVANGKVFVGTPNGVAVFGLLP